MGKRGGKKIIIKPSQTKKKSTAGRVNCQWLSGAVEISNWSFTLDLTYPSSEELTLCQRDDEEISLKNHRGIIWNKELSGRLLRVLAALRLD